MITIAAHVLHPPRVAAARAAAARCWPLRLIVTCLSQRLLMRVSAEEWRAGAISASKIEELTDSFAERGLFVLENVIPLPVLEQLAPRMLSDSHAIVAHGGWSARGEFGHGHLQLGPPRCAPWVHSDIVANPIIEQVGFSIFVLNPSDVSTDADICLVRCQVVYAILRHDCYLGFFNGNCAMPNSGTQRLHMDDQWDWASANEAADAGQEWPHLTTSVHVNFCPTGDVSAENGGTEVWPATHKVYTDNGSTDTGLLNSVHIERQRQRQPPIFNSFPLGAVAFRDAR